MSIITCSFALIYDWSIVALQLGFVQCVKQTKGLQDHNNKGKTQEMWLQAGDETHQHPEMQNDAVNAILACAKKASNADQCTTVPLSSSMSFQ